MKFDADRLISRNPSMWASFLRDWDRSLRAADHPATTRYNYLLAATQLCGFLGTFGHIRSGAGQDPLAVTKADIERFQVWMIETRSASTALNKHKSLQQFFSWLVAEEELDVSPLARVRQPRRKKKLIPIIGEDQTRKVLNTCDRRTFAGARDEAIIRMFANTGARLSEVADLEIHDIDMSLDTALYHGKGGKDRRVRFGPKTGRALSRYIRMRSQHRAAQLSHLWLAQKGAAHLSDNGIQMMLRRRGQAADVEHLHAHRWRHTYAHEWKRAGGDTGDLMVVLGWSSDEMPRHYGASAAAERAQETQARLRIGEDV
ncbi:tyrosine-type recombinase/integrase [Catellatospora sichuanensis]|uniref:tyrosine-type recombinase/integrase n=1 Tax=Catellatospora sichuanensis TaxID=1969805 RepID=UPI001FE7C827|nr:tyrosine-type recombinase/integrase [Catellatospora sichuanensis]